MRRTTLALLLALTPAVVLAAGDDVKALLARVKAAGPAGAGSVEAAKAWQALARLGPEALPVLCAGFDDDDPAASNWVRAATDAVGEKALKDKKPLPADALEKFVLDTAQPAAGRRVAYEWLVRADKSAPARLLPGLLLDRSPELRRDAVAAAMTAAEAALKKDDQEGAKAGYRKALTGACDKDQVDEIAKQLKAFGVAVDLTAHFGFVKQWQVVAPFDNAKGEKFAAAWPPEKSVDLAATYKGKDGADCKWAAHATDKAYGEVDLNKAIGKKKGATAYAFAAVSSPTARRAQLRLGCINAVKVFFNGKEVFACEECHHGAEMDQYLVPVTLKAGRNDILVKVCQNEQTEPWAQNWAFQLRVCDATGVAVPFTVEKQIPGERGASAP